MNETVVSGIVFVSSLLACIALISVGKRERRKMMSARHRLLDEAKSLLTGFRFSLSADQHPIISGTLNDGRTATLDLVSDTMVTRRLPQLWLRVTVHMDPPQPWPAVGVLARPTGSEYYSLVHGLEEWLHPPETQIPVLMRGDPSARDAQWRPLLGGLADLVADAKLKEAAATPRMIRVVFQAAEGERSAHLLLRQARFAVDTVPRRTIRHALDIAATVQSLAAKSRELSSASAA